MTNVWLNMDRICGFIMTNARFRTEHMGCALHMCVIYYREILKVQYMYSSFILKYFV
jgi:hypothetical protein